MNEATDRKFIMTPLAAGVIAALNPSSPALAQESEENSRSLDEITVTATRRELNLQDVAQSITAFSNQDIADMGVRSMSDYVKAMPSIALTETKPGVTSLSIRGISNGAFDYRLQDQTTIYLDEQAMTTSAQNISVRPIDMERIEVLPGPQGTLFGSSSQTGTLRLITNKPDFKEFSGMVQADVATTSGGSESYDISGFLNIPLSEKFAIRAVAYTTLDGGYVDNVYGLSYSGNFDNAEYVEDDYNEYETTGGRLAALWQISDNWDISLNLMTESNESHGEWETDPSLGGDRIVRFFDDFKEDDWLSTGLTLRGDLGFAALSITAQMMDRDFAYEWDNNAYTQRKDRVYGGGYLKFTADCYATNPTYGDGSCYAAGYYAGYSYAPRYYTNYAFSTIVNEQEQEREQLEIRLTSQHEGKLQWMLGGYYEEIYDTWFYHTVMPDHLNTTAWATAQAYAYYYKYYAGYSNVQYPLPDTLNHYVQNMERTNTQVAIFGEIDYDFTDKTRMTFGARWAENERSELDLYEWPEGLPPIGGYGSDGLYGTTGTKSDDTFFKVGLQHRFTDDKMVYALFSQGFRLGGANSLRASGHDSGAIPREYGPDYMDNYEIGMKTEWADGSFVLNASAFLMQWEDVQVSLFGIGQWWVRGTVNANTAESLGMEINFTWQATDNLKLRGSVFSAEAEFTADYFNPVSGDQIIADGQDMPNSPPLKLWGAVMYDIPDFLGGDLSFYFDRSYQGATWNNTDNALNERENGRSTSYTYSTLSAGLQFDNQLNLSLRVSNVFDESTSSYINDSIQNYSEEFPTQTRDRLNSNHGRPRTVWLSLRKDF